MNPWLEHKRMLIMLPFYAVLAAIITQGLSAMNPTWNPYYVPGSVRAPDPYHDQVLSYWESLQFMFSVGFFDLTFFVTFFAVFGFMLLLDFRIFRGEES